MIKLVAPLAAAFAVSWAGSACAAVSVLTLDFSPGAGVVGVGPPPFDGQLGYIAGGLFIEQYTPAPAFTLVPLDVSAGVATIDSGRFLDIIGYRAFKILSFDIDFNQSIVISSGSGFQTTIIPDGIAGFQRINLNAPEILGVWDAVRFNPLSGGPAFKLDNLTYATVVPEPTTWAMMIVGFGLAGVGLRQRRVAHA